MTDDPQDDATREDGPAAREDGATDDEDGDRDRDDDPFLWLHTESDREGDPFDHLPGPDDERGHEALDEASLREDDVGHPSDVVDPGDRSDEGDRSTGAPAAGEADDPQSGRAGGSPVPDASDDGAEAGPTVDTGRDEDPFAGVATPDGDPFEGEAGGVFERVDVDGVDPDRVWEEVAGEAASDAGPAETPAELSAVESRYAEVSKHAYCEQCEHFSAPPEVSCGNPGTEIVEFTDVETVRLLNCPIVAERAALEDES